MNRICKKCLIEKNDEEFYKHSEMKTRMLNFCKSCVRERVSNFYHNNSDSMRKKEKERYQNRKNDPKYKAISRKSTLNYRKRHKIAYKIYKKLYAMRPKHCQHCGIEDSKVYAIHAHHDDYSQPLKVIWLCPLCHSKIHNQN